MTSLYLTCPVTSSHTPSHGPLTFSAVFFLIWLSFVRFSSADSRAFRELHHQPDRGVCWEASVTWHASQPDRPAQRRSARRVRVRAGDGARDRAERVRVAERRPSPRNDGDGPGQFHDFWSRGRRTRRTKQGLHSPQGFPGVLSGPASRKLHRGRVGWRPARGWRGDCGELDECRAARWTRRCTRWVAWELALLATSHGVS